MLLNRRLNETAEDADMIFILSSNRPEAIETAPAVPALSIRQSRCRCLMRFAEARWFAYGSGLPVDEAMSRSRALHRGGQRRLTIVARFPST
ncbi:hypothetical protein XI04_09420 [Bradyrhizobium sp. CCBAU 11430]|nr:hypothetical protein [Bradyrhizobium sp. CCBAU 11430]